MDDRAGAGGVGMVGGPNMNTAVFIRCLGRWRGHSGRRRPPRHRGLDIDDEDMNGGPEEGRYEPVEVSCGYTGQIHDRVENAADGGRIFTEERREKMRRGDIWIVRWSGVREAIARGECELI